MLIVCGEAVLNLFSDGSPAGFQTIPEGVPVNVAVGAAWLGIPTSLLARCGARRFGLTLGAHLSGCRGQPAVDA